MVMNVSGYRSQARSAVAAPALPCKADCVEIHAPERPECLGPSDDHCCEAPLPPAIGVHMGSGMSLFPRSIGDWPSLAPDPFAHRPSEAASEPAPLSN